MKEITIIGAGVSGLALSEDLRKKDSSLKITLIDKEEYYIPRRGIIASPGDISQRIDFIDWSDW